MMQVGDTRTVPKENPRAAKEQAYAEWQRDAAEWANAFDGHGRSPPGPPPKMEPNNLERNSKLAVRRQWESVSQWNTGAGLAVDFSTSTAVFGSRKDKGTPGCLSISPDT